MFIIQEYKLKVDTELVPCLEPTLHLHKPLKLNLKILITKLDIVNKIQPFSPWKTKWCAPLELKKIYYGYLISNSEISKLLNGISNSELISEEEWLFMSTMFSMNQDRMTCGGQETGILMLYFLSKKHSRKDPIIFKYMVVNNAVMEISMSDFPKMAVNIKL